jgi:hypothetical protein
MTSSGSRETFLGHCRILYVEAGILALLVAYVNFWLHM